MFRARPSFARFNLFPVRHFCTKPTNNINNSNSSSSSSSSSSSRDMIESNVGKYEEVYRQLDKLDFMTSAKILFTEPPKKKKFGLDFHLVQLFFACLPSLAVYLVAQYARHEMRKMDEELELKKKKEEEEKAKEMELKAIKEKEARSDPELLEVKVRLDKLEEAIKEIVVDSKKQSTDYATKNQEDIGNIKHIAPTESAEAQSTSEPSKSLDKDLLGKQKSREPVQDKGKVTGLAPTPGASLQDQNGKTQTVGTSKETKK